MMDSIMDFVVPKVRWFVALMGGRRNVVILGVRVYLWPFVMVPLVLALAAGLDALL